MKLHIDIDFDGRDVRVDAQCDQPVHDVLVIGVLHHALAVVENRTFRVFPQRTELPPIPNTPYGTRSQ